MRPRVRKGLSRPLLTIMLAGVDIWAMLFVVHYGNARLRDVSLVISSPDQPPGFAQSEPLQVWLTGAAMGIWPHRDQPLALEEVKQRLSRLASGGRRVELRLLVQPDLSLRQWGRVALELSPHAEDIRIAPLPRAPPAAGALSSFGP